MVIYTAREGDPLGRRRNPARERGVAYVIPEPYHASNGGPAVLAKPVHLQKDRYPVANLLLLRVPVLTTC